MTDAGYKCGYCKRPFVSERAFMRHTCTPMIRSQEIKTAEGSQAYGLYKIWLEKQKRTPPPIETFTTSQYYTSFYKFAVWVRQTGIPQPDKYVELMVEKKISPAIWRRSEAYAFYLEWTDKKSSPIDQAAVTVQTITAISEIAECKPSEVFDTLRVGQILELIQQRRLSPWLLFCSKSFKKWVNKLDSGDRQVLMQGIGIDYWNHRFDSSPSIIKDLRELAESMGI